MIPLLWKQFIQYYMIIQTAKNEGGSCTLHNVYTELWIESNVLAEQQQLRFSASVGHLRFGRNCAHKTEGNGLEM